jgi:hypothetical protein
MLTPEQRLGFVDPETLPKELDSTGDEERVKKARENMPPLSSILNLKDMEVSHSDVLLTFAELNPPERRLLGASCPRQPGLTTAVRLKMSGVCIFKPQCISEPVSAYLNNLGAFNFYWFRPRV